MRSLLHLYLGYTLCCIAAPEVRAESVRVGRYSISLEGDGWEQVSTQTAAMGTQSGSSGQPQQKTVVMGKQFSEGSRAVLIFRAPTNTFIGVNSWQNDPCASFRSALFRDTTGQTFSMPDCLAIEEYDSQGLINKQDKVLQDIERWFVGSGKPIPAKLLRVHYSKFYGGEFLVFNAYLPLEKGQLGAVEPWARTTAGVLRAAVTAGIAAQLPPLPGPDGSFKAPPLARPNTAQDRLMQLKDLYDRGLITEVEFQKTRKQILDEI